MKALAVQRAKAKPARLVGAILAHDVRDATGARALAKGSRLADADAVAALLALPWETVHVVVPEAGELHEAEAGERIARAAAGDGVRVGALGAGHWPLVSAARGIVSVEVERLWRVNCVEGISVYALYDGHVVDAGETIGRAKITPFVLAEGLVKRAVALAADAEGLVRVRPFQPRTIGVVVQETIGERGVARFRSAIGEKISWLGSRLLEPEFVEPTPDGVAAGVESVLGQGADVVVLAGAKAMDPLDPAYLALDRLGVTLERYGVPAHPGSLFWLAHRGEVPILGMPSCGLFSQATTFDLILPRVLTGERVSADTLAALGHGGMLSKEYAFRFPKYREGGERGAVE